MRLADPSVFRSEFHGILATYFGLYPDGRLKFNLYGLAPGHLPHQSLTVWELEQVSTIYPHKTDYYLYNSDTGYKKHLSPADAYPYITSILSD